MKRLLLCLLRGVYYTTAFITIVVTVAICILLLTSCAHQPPRVAPSVSTAGLSRSLTSAKGSISAAKASAGNAAGRVDAARGIAGRVDSKATVVLEYLNGK